MNKLSFAWFFAAASIVGCGGSVGGSSGGGTGGAGGSGGSGGSTVSTTSTTETILPPQCVVETSDPAPYAVSFQFTVGPNQSAFLEENCYTVFTVTSCADGYNAAVPLHGDCTVDCSETMGCMECGACLPGTIAVTEGAPHSVDWSGVTYTFGENQAGCECHTAWNAPAGKYRVSVPVYPTEQDATDHTNGTTLSVDFDLPAPNGIVTVPVGLQPN